jgi:predicted PurR-regulated permease PerM
MDLKRSVPRSYLKAAVDKYSPLIVFGSFLLIIASLYLAQAVLIPIAVAVLLTFLLTPVVSAIEGIRLGRVPAVIFVVIVTFSLLIGIGWAITAQIATLASELPKYKINLRQKVVDMKGLGKGGTVEKVQETIEEIKDEIKKDEAGVTKARESRPVVVQAEESSTFWPLPLDIAPMIERLASAGLAIVLVIFMLIQREDMRNRLIRLIGYGRLTATTKAMEEAAERISRYLLMQSIINGSFGLGIGIGLFFIGLPYALLWGFLAAILRFIPYVGPWAAAAMPVILSLAVFTGWEGPLLVVGLFLVLELAANMILEPWLYGESAGVSEVALLISISFWTWLWGPIGLLLATPLTVCLVVLAKYVPQIDFLFVLMSTEPVMEPKISFYQRLLAMDQDEAADIVEDSLKNQALEQIYDELLIPALTSAKRDRQEGSLTKEDEQFVYQATQEIIEDLNNRQLSSTENLEKDNGAHGSVATAKVWILGCPARDAADKVGLLMFQQLLDPNKYQVELISQEHLASEVVILAADKKPQLVCISALPPGGLAQTRYLCKRLRARFPDVKLMVGRWGEAPDAADNRSRLLAAGADEVGTSLVETRDIAIRLTSHGSKAAPGSESNPLGTAR